MRANKICMQRLSKFYFSLKICPECCGCSLVTNMSSVLHSHLPLEAADLHNWLCTTSLLLVMMMVMIILIRRWRWCWITMLICITDCAEPSSLRTLTNLPASVWLRVIHYSMLIVIMAMMRQLTLKTTFTFKQFPIKCLFLCTTGGTLSLSHMIIII